MQISPNRTKSAKIYYYNTKLITVIDNFPLTSRILIEIVKDN